MLVELSVVEQRYHAVMEVLAGIPSPTSPPATGCPDNRSTPGSPVTVNTVSRAWPTDPTDRTPAPTKPVDRSRPSSANYAAPTPSGDHGAWSTSWTAGRSPPCPPGPRSTGS
jgi:hypothetical protein